MTDKWRVHQDRMDTAGFCEIVGNNDIVPHLTYSVEIYDRPGNVAVSVVAHTLDHTPAGRIDFNIPALATHIRSCQVYLMAAEKTFKTLGLSLMQIPRIHRGGFRPIRIRGPGGFDVDEYAVNNSTRIWVTSSWVQLHCPYGNGYTIFNTSSSVPVLHANGACGSIAFVREQFRENCVS